MFRYSILELKLQVGSLWGEHDKEDGHNGHERLKIYQDATDRLDGQIRRRHSFLRVEHPNMYAIIDTESYHMLQLDLWRSVSIQILCLQGTPLSLDV
jgi:hypothetical protein